MIDVNRQVNTAVSATAVFLYVTEPKGTLLDALRVLQTSSAWKLVMTKLDKTKAEAFRINKVPAMIFYNVDGAEKARAIGDVNIKNTITKLGLEDG